MKPTQMLRPKAGENQAHFYTLVSRDTVEQEFALKRQLFLCEQGYTYNIVDGDEMESFFEDYLSPDGSNKSPSVIMTKFL